MIQLDGAKLVRLRMKKRWTQKQASERAGVSQPTYNRAENGKTIQPLKAERIIAAFKSDLDELEQAHEEKGDAA